MAVIEAITKRQLDAAVKALAQVDRPAAVAILAKFGALNTAELKSEQWQVVFEAFEEAREIPGTP